MNKPAAAYKPVTIIGSREIKEPFSQQLYHIAKYLAKQGYILRTGGAAGADNLAWDAFDSVKGEIELFLPWPKFNGHISKFDRPPAAAYDLAARFHPNWINLKDTVRPLMARNCQQVLGQFLDSPTTLVLCWTPFDLNNRPTGGTSMAIRLAEHYKIPVINLGQI